MIKKIPLPIAGLILGMAALGNLLQSYSETLRYIFGIISFILAILFLIKLISYPKLFVEDMKSPFLANVFCTFPMAIILLSGYLKALIGENAIFIYYFGLILHGLTIIYIVKRFIFRLDLKEVFASYYIVFVGYLVASVLSPVFNTQYLGKILFWCGFVSLLFLLVIINYRYIKYKEIKEPLQSLFVITAAPTSLCLAAYIQSFEEKSMILMIFLLILSQALYILVLTKMPKFLRFKFYPSTSAFSFPFVITAISLKMFTNILVAKGYAISLLFNLLVGLETVVAIYFCIFVLYSYLLFIFKSEKKVK